MKQKSKQANILLDKSVPPEEVAASIIHNGYQYQMPPEILQEFQQKTLKESPSSIRVFLQCQLRWFIERYADVPPDTETPVDEYNRWGVLGTFVHRVLELFYNEPAHLRTRKVLKSTLELCLDEMIDGGTSGMVDADLIKGYAYVVEHDPWYRRAPHKFGPFEGWLEENAYDMVKAVYEFEDPKEVEVIENESWIRGYFNNVLVRGKVDRTILDELGRVIIDDWKTGKSPPQDEIIEVISESFIAMGIYALLYKHVEHQNNARVRLLHLKTREEIDIRMNQRRLDVVTSLLDSVTKRMNEIKDTGLIGTNPGENASMGACTHCPVSGICPVFKEDGSWDETQSSLRIGIYRPETESVEPLERQ